MQGGHNPMGRRLSSHQDDHMGDHLSDLAADKNVVYHRGTMNPNF